MSTPLDAPGGPLPAPDGECLFLKLGGSLLTDKTRPQSLYPEVLARLAAEIVAARAKRPDQRLLIGHGSGSFGHMVARQFNTRDGVHTAEEWRGFAATGRAAAQLNRLVVDALGQAGLPVLGLQPSSSAICRDGRLVALEYRPILAALEHGLVPVVYGDVGIDEMRGGTIISTEELFGCLAPRLTPRRIVLVGDVAGVLAGRPDSHRDGDVIPVITPADVTSLQTVLGGSRGVDVTGGMLAKVAGMAALVASCPTLTCVHIISGLVPGLVHDVLVDPTVAAGTRIVPN